MEAHMEALKAFALRNGRNRWRENLRTAWCCGNYWKFGSDSAEASLLQSMRNHSAYGPGSGFIESFKPFAKGGK